MAKILGLDLGTNSIGWALIDDVQNKILGIGSRIFQWELKIWEKVKEEKCLKMLDEQEQEVFVVNF
jgi:CRISPR/Cas system Type II protein with McrA/HNH and RuvC-like nuclease domain